MKNSNSPGQRPIWGRLDMLSGVRFWGERGWCDIYVFETGVEQEYMRLGCSCGAHYFWLFNGGLCLSHATFKLQLHCEYTGVNYISLLEPTRV